MTERLPLRRFVIPGLRWAEPGIQFLRRRPALSLDPFGRRSKNWIPACAGMTAAEARE